jgi:predicted ATP-grasp superfamily ATP-dependent carboligase
MQPESSPVLLVAVTGRALAASAARAGRPAIVLDCFADRDTRALARHCRSVRAAGAIRFHAHALLAAAAELAPPAESEGLIYGAGFEGRPTLLARLAQGRRLLGNRPCVVAAIKDPRRFFPLLDRVGIPHPEVRYATPDDGGAWLVKRVGGAGGTHVRPAGAGPARAGHYFQRFQPGEPCSVLFVADGKRARIIGFNRQWAAAPQAAQSYLYGGAVGRIALPAGVASGVRDRLDALVAASGLVGLNGLDFMMQDGEWSALEVNPRPTATMDLYDPDFPCGLLDWHMRAARGELPDAAVPGGPARAHGIVRAPLAWEVPTEFRFPEWCRDLPDPLARFSPGDPVCTVHAAAGSPEPAVELVRERAAALTRTICHVRTEAVHS